MMKNPFKKKKKYPTIFGESTMPTAKDVSMTKEQIDELFKTVDRFNVVEFRQLVEKEIKPKVSVPFKISEVK